MRNSLAELIECWENSPFPSMKVTSYFPVYANLFENLRGTNCTFIETGILDGGSLHMWRNWLGKEARIIGIDLNPEAAKWKEAGFEIYIGDQGDPKFWEACLKQIGKFDVLLDDGGHQSFQQIVTVIEAIKAANDRCLIVVEDTHSCFMNEFSNHGKYSFLEYCKSATDCILGRAFPMYPKQFPLFHNKEQISFFKSVLSIQFFTSIVAFHVDPKASIVPELCSNKAKGLASDFRYLGKKNAILSWPNIYSNMVIKVNGGRASFFKKLSSLPAKIYLKILNI
jgi:hypothetical protein